MGHRSWTASSIGDPVIEISHLESETTKFSPLVWPVRRITASTPAIATTRTITVGETDGLRIIVYIKDLFPDPITAFRESILNTKRRLAYENVATFYRQRSLGYDNGSHLLWAAVHANQSCFQHVRNRACYRSSTDKLLGLVPSFQQPMVGL